MPCIVDAVVVDAVVVDAVAVGLLGTAYASNLDWLKKESPLKDSCQ